MKKFLLASVCLLALTACSQFEFCFGGDRRGH